MRLLKSALEGNTTAQIFWLKNRLPDKWRDKPKEETDRTITVKFEQEIEEYSENFIHHFVKF